MTRRAFTIRQVIDMFLYRVELQFGEPLKCAISGDPMRPGDPVQIDHIHAVTLGGPHVYTNFRPVLVEPHKRKSKRDVQAKSKIDRITGVTCNGPKAKVRSAGFSKTLRRRMNGKVERCVP
jgi:5-methylcytosine-specific restriction endonuclease McrA